MWNGANKSSIFVCWYLVLLYCISQSLLDLQNYIDICDLNFVLFSCIIFSQPFRRATGYKHILLTDPDREIYKGLKLYEKANLEDTKLRGMKQEVF